MKIVYTHTDEAPALATQSLLPIVRAFAGVAGVELELRDISLSGRILAQFPDRLSDEQRVGDALTELGELATTPEANIIKLPNISASVPQLKAAIAELQAAGYAVPDYPDDPSTDEQRDVRKRYDRVKGSAVNPVLREGNSDRRAPASVKAYARNHPHSMGAWSPASKSRVVTMDDGDFRATEQSVTVAADGVIRIEHVDADGKVTVLKPDLPVLGGEVVDAAVMERETLDEFLADQLEAARRDGILFSVHLKATMMKVSDPIIFGHAVRAYFADLFASHGDALAGAGLSADDGLGALLGGLDRLPVRSTRRCRRGGRRGVRVRPVAGDGRLRPRDHEPARAVRRDHRCVDAGRDPRLGTDVEPRRRAQQDTLFVIPDHSYAALYAETVEDCRRNGAFDPADDGHDAKRRADGAEGRGVRLARQDVSDLQLGTVRVVDGNGATLLSHEVAPGDIWRACQTKHAAVVDWVALAVRRARASGAPAVFWLDETRAHDAQLLSKVHSELARADTDGLTIEILPVAEATRFTLARARAGEDTISVTGNVLRDYLTDLFPILELGTSAKMLSIVPLMHGGGLFETGAGGSAPKHVQQFEAENHLRWDSLGEFLALAVSLEMLADTTDNPRARLLGETLDRATGRVLEQGHSPSRRVHELDNRGSHFYLALYWADELASQSDDAELAQQFAPLARQLADAEQQIVAELDEVQGAPVDVGGYYRPDPDRVAAAMRPIATFNEALASLSH